MREDGMPVIGRRRKNVMRDNPPTAVANDGTTKLRRYRVDAVIYARNLTEARARLREVDHVFDDAMIEPPGARRAR
jgi:hypothetical protein